MIRKQGDYAQAEGYFQESLALARQLGVPEITSTVLYEYGNLYLDRQQAKIAEANFLEILSTVSEGDQDLKALAQYGLARSALIQGNTNEAWKLGDMSVTTLEEIGHRHAQEVRAWLDSIGR
jgi:tetratricopeptide (TPR) repeat protein